VARVRLEQETRAERFTRLVREIFDADPATNAVNAALRQRCLDAIAAGEVEPNEEDLIERGVVNGRSC
jgi:hypothetical protein